MRNCVYKVAGIFCINVLLGINSFAQTVDLNSRVSNPNSPATADVVWFTTPDRSSPALSFSEASAVVATSVPQNYYAFFTNGNNCWSPGAKVTIVEVSCPAATVDLTAFTGPAPTGTQISWYKDRERLEPVSVPEAAGKGTYFAFYEDISNPLHCFSPASSPLIVEGNCPVPIGLSEFVALKQGKQALLQWVTHHEQNNAGFEVQRSGNGKDWVVVGFVRSKSADGIGSQKLHYSLMDHNPLHGRNLYRLKQIDGDGRFTFSDTRLLYFEISGGISVSPNPASEHVIIGNLSGGEKLLVYDALGRLHIERVATGTTETIDLHLLAAGVYTIHVIDSGGGREMYKLVRN